MNASIRTKYERWYICMKLFLHAQVSNIMQSYISSVTKRDIEHKELRYVLYVFRVDKIITT